MQITLKQKKLETAFRRCGRDSPWKKQFYLLECAGEAFSEASNSNGSS